MKYLELSNEAKETALIDYCDLMQMTENDNNKKKVVDWFEKYNHDVFNEDGLLKHRNRNR